MKYDIVLSIYMSVEADTPEDAHYKAETTTEAIFERNVQLLDKEPGITVGAWFCDYAG